MEPRPPMAFLSIYICLGKNSIEKGHGWACTRLSLFFNFSRIIFARAKSKGMERESLGARLGRLGLKLVPV